MEPLAIIATLVVVVLQIITVALTVKTKKMVRELSNKQPVSSFSHDKQERRDRDFRQNRRPGQDSRPKQPQAQQANGNNAADPVEKSLRDINLKLKNAERDQEFARRKIQENFPKDHPQNNRRRDFRDNRDSRDGNGDRRGGRDHRRGNDNRRGPWQDRNSHKEHTVQQSSAEAPEETNAAAVTEASIPVSIPSPEPQVVMEPETPVTTPTTPESTNQDLVPSDFGTEDLQHGRKNMAKRRLLKEEESQGDEIGVVETETPAEVSTQNETNQQGEAELEQVSEPSSEIRFGRR